MSEVDKTNEVQVRRVTKDQLWLEKVKEWINRGKTEKERNDRAFRVSIDIASMPFFAPWKGK